MRISIDPNSSSRVWPGKVSAHRSEEVVLSVGQLVTVVQEYDGEPDYIGDATVIGIRDDLVGLDVDWASFRDEAPSDDILGLVVSITSARSWPRGSTGAHMLPDFDPLRARVLQ